MPAAEVLVSTLVLFCRSLRRRSLAADFPLDPSPPSLAITIPSYCDQPFSLPGEFSWSTMANPFPSDWSLTKSKKQDETARPFGIRKLSVKGILSFCSQLLSRHSTNASLPELVRCLSPSEQAQSSAASSVTTPRECIRFPTSRCSPRSRKQRSQQELRNLSESQLGLRLALILPDESRAASTRSRQIVSNRPRVAAQVEEGLEGAIPFLDISAVEEEGLRRRGTRPHTARLDDEMRLQEHRQNAGLNEDGGRAGRYVAPRDLLLR